MRHPFGLFSWSFFLSAKFFHLLIFVNIVALLLTLSKFGLTKRYPLRSACQALSGSLKTGQGSINDFTERFYEYEKNQQSFEEPILEKRSTEICLEICSAFALVLKEGENMGRAIPQKRV